MIRLGVIADGDSVSSQSYDLINWSKSQTSIELICLIDQANTNESVFSMIKTSVLKGDFISKLLLKVITSAEKILLKKYIGNHHKRYKKIYFFFR